ncbi:uncharacterized protein LOC141651825 [Silene latifolia]|uniref:uncharacterized protein LOC141651825 n=1 Tax=Silene latifolia TaxID=37657 RepID=UPI003D778402
MTGDDAKSKGSGSGLKTIPMTSPLYLHPSDSPSLNVTQIIFDGTNYDMWADAVKNGLDAKNKLAFIEGRIKKPASHGEEDSLELVAWRQCNAMLRAWLQNVIDPKLHPSITFTQPIEDVWEELRVRYSAGNAPRVHQLKSELNECKQGKETIVEYYTRLKTIWDELAKYSKIKDCNCGAAASIAKEKEEEKVHQFLMGLDSKLYGQVRTNLLMEDPIAQLNRVYALILREEQHASLTKIKEEYNDAAMSVKVNGEKGRGNYSRDDEENSERPPPPRCTYCEKYYHKEENCYDKHGYEEVKARERGRGRRGNGGSRGSGSRGRGRGRGYHQAHAVTGTGKGKEQVKSNIPFTAEEIDRLKILLKTSPEGSEKTPSLPDGRQVKATVHGKVRLSENFILKDVLFVPSLTCDLISVQQLIHENNCLITFYPDYCEMQDPTTKTMIGRGEHRRRENGDTREGNEQGINQNVEHEQQVTGAQPEQEVMGRGAREKFAPAWKKDYYCKSTRVITPNSNAHLAQSKSSRSGTRYPLNDYVMTDCFSNNRKAFLATIDNGQEPTYYYEAAKDRK